MEGKEEWHKGLLTPPKVYLPAHLLPLLVVVALFAHPSEAGPSEAVQLQAELLAFAVGHHVDVGLLAYNKTKRLQKLH
jgi:hypothetical protein